MAPVDTAWKGRLTQVAAKYGDVAPTATVCCNACRTCVQTNLVAAALAGVTAATADAGVGEGELLGARARDLLLEDPLLAQKERAEHLAGLARLVERDLELRLGDESLRGEGRAEPRQGPRHRRLAVVDPRRLR